MTVLGKTATKPNPYVCASCEVAGTGTACWCCAEPVSTAGTVRRIRFGGLTAAALLIRDCEWIRKDITRVFGHGAYA